MGNQNSGRKPNNLPQTFEQMIASNEARKPKKKSRRDYIDENKAEISMLVGDLADRLEAQEANRVKISLKDTESVKQITLTYIRSCQVTGTLPTQTGIALACGCDPYALDIFMRRNPDHSTTKWLKSIKAHFGDLLNRAALAGDVSPIPAIFTLKANYNWSDQPIQEAVDNSNTEELSPDAIAAKYDDMPD